jgi:hypothetical protein
LLGFIHAAQDSFRSEVGKRLIARKLACMPLEVKRVRDGTCVDPTTKGLGPSGDPDEWLITVGLNALPNTLWRLAWSEQMGSLEGDLREAEWEFEPDDRRIHLWATAANAETLIRQLDMMLTGTNSRCAELSAKVEQRQITPTEHDIYSDHGPYRAWLASSLLPGSRMPRERSRRTTPPNDQVLEEAARLQRRLNDLGE